MKDEAPVIDPVVFAEAGKALQSLNNGDTCDLTPCSKVATVLDVLRTPAGFAAVGEEEQARLRAAAAKVRPRLGEGDRILNFLTEAFGATKRPAKVEPYQRTRVGTFLQHVANAG